MSRRTRYGRTPSAQPRGPRTDGVRLDGARPDVLPARDPHPREVREVRDGRGAARNGHQPVAASVPPPSIVGGPRIDLDRVVAADALSPTDVLSVAPLTSELPADPSMAPANGNGSGNGHAPAALVPPPLGSRASGCTAPQLRRFIKSRTYVPMHELRRRFGIEGTEDDVSPVHADGHRIFVGLPPREGRLLEELLRGGDVGYELSMDPLTPVVIGLYPMRPVPRS